MAIRRTLTMLLILLLAWPLGTPTVFAEAPLKEKALPPIPLTLDEVHAWVDRTHPLLQGSGTEKIVARGKLLKALGAFEPALVNDFELERLVKDGVTKSVGFNDSFLDLRHPSGVRAIGGFRVGVGDIEIAD